MSRLPVVSGKELTKRLEKIGFQLVRQEGSHMILWRESPKTTVSVPDHKELKKGTLRTILQQINLPVDGFKQLK